MLEELLSIGNEAVEIHLTDIIDDPSLFPLEAQDLITDFTYRSLHLPANISYPSTSAEDVSRFLKPIIERIKPHALVIHPDTVTDFKWLRSRYGSLLAFENMDSRKNFGLTVDDLLDVFRMVPEAKWVFDVNHIYTIDPSMALAGEFYDALGTRLTHYHVSGYGNQDLIHTCLHESGEDSIATAIRNDHKPLILEGIAHQPHTTLQAERNYVSALMLP